jgi:hypothetical protein
VLLVFVSVVALALRDEADGLVELYWECLKQAAPGELRGDYPAGGGGGGGGDEWYGSRGLLHVEVAAAACVSAALALLLGMVCACRVIGWHVVARVSVLLISVSTGVLGAALLGAGAVMAATTSLKPLLDEAVIAMGVAMLLLSLLGVVGSLRESRCLLRTYAAVLLLTLLALVAGCIVLGALANAGTLGGWLDQGWDLVQEQGLQITREEFQQLVGAPPPPHPLTPSPPHPLTPSPPHPLTPSPPHPLTPSPPTLRPAPPTPCAPRRPAPPSQPTGRASSAPCPRLSPARPLGAADKHILGLITISSLLALVLGLDCVMVCVLQSSIRKRGRRDETEMESLVVTD